MQGLAGGGGGGASAQAATTRSTAPASLLTLVDAPAVDAIEGGTCRQQGRGMRGVRRPSAAAATRLQIRSRIHTPPAPFSPTALHHHARPLRHSPWVAAAPSSAASRQRSRKDEEEQEGAAMAG